MSESTVLSPTDLEAYLPHRGVNMIPDEIEILPGGTSVVARVGPVDPDDARGRGLFARSDGAGGRCWCEPFLGEILALAGVSLLRERLSAEGKEGVYSSISRIRINGPLDMNQPIEASAEISRDRGAFTQFTGRIKQNGVVMLDGEMMSGAAPLAEVASQPARPGSGVGSEALQADCSYKQPSLRFIDDVRSFDAEAGHLVAGYTYPTDHPFVPGHFPDAALMMGVTQWLSVFDAGHEAMVRQGLTTAMVNGALKREDGTEIVDVRDLKIVIENGVPFIRETKRVAFREPVRPGDGLLADVTITAVDA